MHSPKTFTDRWEIIRQRGKIKYILQRGVLSYGLLCFFLFVFLIPFLNSDLALDFIQDGTLGKKLLLFTPLSLIIGYIIGLLGWNAHERYYQDHKKDS